MRRWEVSDENISAEVDAVFLFLGVVVLDSCEDSKKGKF